MCEYDAIHSACCTQRGFSIICMGKLTQGTLQRLSATGDTLKQTPGMPLQFKFHSSSTALTN
ncbi:hypothetical protein [Streptomyces sparsus]